MERGVGLLKNQPDFGPAQPGELRLAQSFERLPTPADRAGHGAATRGQEAANRQGEGGLAAPGLAQDPHALACKERQVDPIERPHWTIARSQLDAQIPYHEERCGRLR